MMDGDKMRQMAKDLQTLLASFAVGVTVYEREAPRNADGAISVEPPFAVYTADTRAPENEGGEWAVDLTIDVWSIGSYDGKRYVLRGPQRPGFRAHGARPRRRENTTNAGAVPAKI